MILADIALKAKNLDPVLAIVDYRTVPHMDKDTVFQILGSALRTSDPDFATPVFVGLAEAAAAYTNRASLEEYVKENATPEAMTMIEKTDEWEMMTD